MVWSYKTGAVCGNKYGAEHVNGFKVSKSHASYVVGLASIIEYSVQPFFA
jgi:hypothetical protein